MTSPARRAVSVAAELDRINSIRSRRRQTMAARWFARLGPAAVAAFLMDLAELDARARRLGELVLDQMTSAEAAGWRPYDPAAAVPPRDDPWIRGRHAAP